MPRCAALEEEVADRQLKSTLLRCSAHKSARVVDAFLKKTQACERTRMASDPSTRDHGWLAMSAQFERLRSTPYMPLALVDDDREYARDSLGARDWFARTFRCTDTSASSRAGFVTWRVFFEKKNSRFVYMPTKAILSAAARADVRESDAMPYLKELTSANGTATGTSTHSEFAKMQSSIRVWCRGARVVCAGAAAAIDAGDHVMDAQQTRCAKGILTTGISFLTGGAGTGKTTVVASIAKCLVSSGARVVCLAPTHRAKKNLAKRMPRNVPVCTVDAFVRSSSNDTPAFVFIDESSMLDLHKLSRLSRSVMECKSWQVCMVGDPGQLEPIERGEMFRTATRSEEQNVFHLDRCYRAENVDLLQAQETIRGGSIPTNSNSFQIDLLPSDASVEKKVVELVAGIDPDNAQFIAWTNRTCSIINRAVQLRVHGQRAPSTPGSILVGDRVVYNGKNDLSRDLTNAMIGIATSVKPSGIDVKWEDGRDVMAPTRDVSLAYCITVHKAQGSEFDSVYVVATSVALMASCLDRRWLYTASSRARRACRVITTPDIRGFVSAPLRKREPVGIKFCASVDA